MSEELGFKGLIQRLMNCVNNKILVQLVFCCIRLKACSHRLYGLTETIF